MVAQATWQTNFVEAESNWTLSTRLARILARADGPETATDMAKLVHLPGTPTERGAAIRAELRGSDTFVEKSRGRWRLGNLGSTEVSGIKTDDVADWLRRAHHRKTNETAKILGHFGS